MANEFLVTMPCNVCEGDGQVLQWPGTNTEGSSDPPDQVTCPICNAGIRTVGKVTIPQLDQILDKATDTLDKCNDILDKCNDILENLPGH